MKIVSLNKNKKEFDRTVNSIHNAKPPVAVKSAKVLETVLTKKTAPPQHSPREQTVLLDTSVSLTRNNSSSSLKSDSSSSSSTDSLASRYEKEDELTGDLYTLPRTKTNGKNPKANPDNLAYKRAPTKQERKQEKQVASASNLNEAIPGQNTEAATMQTSIQEPEFGTLEEMQAMLKEAPKKDDVTKNQAEDPYASIPADLQDNPSSETSSAKDLNLEVESTTYSSESGIGSSTESLLFESQVEPLSKTDRFLVQNNRSTKGFAAELRVVDIKNELAPITEKVASSQMLSRNEIKELENCLLNYADTLHAKRLSEVLDSYNHIFGIAPSVEQTILSQDQLISHLTTLKNGKPVSLRDRFLDPKTAGEKRNWEVAIFKIKNSIKLTDKEQQQLNKLIKKYEADPTVKAQLKNALNAYIAKEEFLPAFVGSPKSKYEKYSSSNTAYIKTPVQQLKTQQLKTTNLDKLSKFYLKGAQKLLKNPKAMDEAANAPIYAQRLHLNRQILFVDFILQKFDAKLSEKEGTQNESGIKYYKALRRNVLTGQPSAVENFQKLDNNIKNMISELKDDQYKEILERAYEEQKHAGMFVKKIVPASKITTSRSDSISDTGSMNESSSIDGNVVHSRNEKTLSIHL